MNEKIKRTLMFAVENDIPTMFTGEECDQIINDLETETAALKNEIQRLQNIVMRRPPQAGSSIDCQSCDLQQYAGGLWGQFARFWGLLWAH